MKLYPHDLEFLLCLIPLLPGICLAIRTRAWSRPRLWLYTFLHLRLIFIGTRLVMPSLLFWGGMVLSMAILTAVETALVLFGKRERKPAFMQFASLLLCLPLLSHFWSRYVGYFLSLAISVLLRGIWNNILGLFM